MRRCNVWRTVLLLTVAWAAGDRAGGQVTGREAPVQAVTLSVVALDSKGQPVGDLTADDFRITDAGKPQKLSVFRHSDAKLQQAPPLSPGEFSNRTAANVPHATLILFDMFNDSFGAQGGAANNIIQGLKTLESADDLFLYILTPEDKIYPVHPLPGPDDAPAAVGDVPWTRDVKTILDQAVAKVYGLHTPGIDIDTKVRATYRSLESVGMLLAGIPGRKNIVWITHGVPITIGPEATVSGQAIDYTPLLRQLSVALGRMNVAIYPVMQVPPGMATEGTPEAQHSGLGSQDTLQQFADLTGGPVTSTGSIGAIVRQAMNDVRTSYQLGYSPPPENWDGKFHKLRVTCSRKGVRIQAKTGYYAVPEQSGDEQEAMTTAEMSSYDAAEIGMRGSESKSPRGAGVFHFALHINAADVRIVQQGDRYLGHLGLQVARYIADGSPERGPVTPIDLSWSADDLAKAKRDGIEWTQDINLGADAAKVRFVVFDRESHAVGSLTMPLSGK